MAEASGDSGVSEPSQNRVVLDGEVCNDPDTRFSPAGIPITRFTLEHCSRRPEAAHQREVRCRVSVVAAGEELADRSRQLCLGMRVRVTGFLAGAGYRASDYRLTLHADDLDIFEESRQAR